MTAAASVPAAASLPADASARPAERRLHLAPRPGPAPLLLLANGNASGVVDRQGVVEQAGALLRRAGARVETLLTSSLDELAELWPGDPERRVVLLGGDGTVHAAANLPGLAPELAILPAGGANNVAASLGIPLDLRAAADVAVTGTPQPIDLIAARSPERSYLAVEGVSVGFLALARSQYRAENSTDVRATLAAGLKAFASFRPFCAGIEADGAAEIRRISQLFVANLPRYGPALRVAPQADPGDGLLDLVTVETAGLLSLPAMLARLRRGTHLGRPEVRVSRASRLRIAPGGQSPVIADSTDLGHGPVELEAVPQALRVVIPRR